MNGGIFLLRGEDELVPMREAPYESEDVLQELLARFPDLLAGDRSESGSGRRWILIDRESRVPDDIGSGGRWSLDHLFIDQDGVPTLVEVKRSSDTRIRREVVGQLIDYAANAVVYWPIERLRESFESRLEHEEIDVEEEMAKLLEPDADVEAFWEQVGANLKAGRIRMVFVSDEIPRELRRVVEFLNEQMTAEVLAIEVKQYVGREDGLRTLVPRMVGQTAAAETRKASRERRKWDETSLLTEIEETKGEAELRAAQGLLDWARGRPGMRFWWSSGAMSGSCFPYFKHAGYKHWPFSLRSDGQIKIGFDGHSKHPPFDDEELRRELLHRINHVPGMDIPADAINRVPSFRLSVLAESPEALDTFKSALDWYCETVLSYPGG